MGEMLDQPHSADGLRFAIHDARIHLHSSGSGQHRTETGIEGVDFIAINTDLQALETNQAKTKYQIGKQLTKGLRHGDRIAV